MHFDLPFPVEVVYVEVRRKCDLVHLLRPRVVAGNAARNLLLYILILEHRKFVPILKLNHPILLRLFGERAILVLCNLYLAPLLAMLINYFGILLTIQKLTIISVIGVDEYLLVCLSIE